MITHKKVWIVGGIIILFQIIYFKDYLSPFQWEQIKVTGLACTCPDEEVVNGQSYLRSIAPDSLKKYKIDYSEIYVTERPATTSDPMGVDEYIIKGKVIGIKRVSEYDPWNLNFHVDSWREVNIIQDIIIKILLFIELVIFVMTLRRTRKTVHNRGFVK